MTMVTFLPSSVESCEGGHGICHHLLEKRGSTLPPLNKERSMTMVIFLLASVESCGGGHYLLAKRKPGLLVLRRRG